ncbi:MAG: cellulosome protein [Prevotella sp.]
MKKIITAILFLAIVPLGAMAQRIQQKLGRAVVAVGEPALQDMLVTWRKLSTDADDCTYNLYMRAEGASEYTKVNTAPITVTNYKTTRNVIPYGTELAVTTVSGGVESEKSASFVYRQHAWKDVFFEFDFETTILNPNDYKCKYAWPMDLDGNGEVDAVLADRLYAGSEGKSHKLQAYLLDGTCLWTIDIGMNVDICAGQNDMVTVYDIDCDGRCEVIIKSSDGTRFWDSANGTWGKYANGSLVPDTDGDGIENYRTQKQRNPPFYVSVVDARTGEEKACSELKYDEVRDGTDAYSRDNRADYMDDGDGTEYAFLGAKFVICYFDGIHPSLAVEAYNRRTDKEHHYYMFAWGYDWTGGHPSNWHHYYTWSRNDKKPNPAEFHQLRVADTDGDGIDEMLEGGFGVNPVKGMVYSAGIGHGDRFDVTDIDPDRPGMEVFAIQQSDLLGQILYDARTGEHIKEWYLPSVFDVGRGRCIDVDADHKGLEIFSLLENLYDCKGNVIAEGATTYPHEASWWDGDLQREMIGSPGGSGYGTNAMMQKYNGSRLLEFSKQSDWAVHTGWANRPAFMGDITGDWREEVILMKQNEETSTGLVGYSTDIPTEYSIPALLEDPHYRLDCTGRGYYQMPCPGYYLGGDMPTPPLPPIMTADLRWQSGTSWAAGGSGFVTFDCTASAAYDDSRSVIFDISGSNSSPITIASQVSPTSLYIMNPEGHDYTFGGTGSVAGATKLYKSMGGTAVFNCNLNHTGGTLISEGKLFVNGKIAGLIDLRSRGTLGGNAEIDGSVKFEGALNYEGCRLMPTGTTGTITFNNDLTIPGNVYIEVEAAEGNCGHVCVKGNLTFEGENTFTINHNGLHEGDYILAECTGTLTADVEKISMRGMVGINYELRTDANRLIMHISSARLPMDGVVWTGSESALWDYRSNNFSVSGNATTFVPKDKVTFNDDASVRTITVNDMMVTDGVTFNVDGGKYTFTGSGGISGTGGITKNGTGEVRIELANSDYTGATIVNEGTLTITSLADGGRSCAIGATTADLGNLQLNGGTLKIDADNMATDRIVSLTDTSVINIANAKGSLSLKGKVTGSGYLVKEGSGQLNFTYEGTNSFAGLILRDGIVAQGSWNSTFGSVGSPMLLEGGALHLIDMNNSSTRPIFNYVATVPEGKSCTIQGTTRGAINGSFKGSGTLTIISSGVRNDIGADFSAFSGKLNATGANFRLMDNVTDMSRTEVIMESGCYIGHYTSNGSGTKAVTTKMGSLAASAKDCTLGNGIDTYLVGYNGLNTNFAGVLNAKTIGKYGNGTLTLTSSESTSSVEVYGGTLQLYNSPYSASPTPFTTGSLTVKNGGQITGLGCIPTTKVENGGVVTAGYNGSYGTLKAVGDVTLSEGSKIVVKIGCGYGGYKSNDSYSITGALIHQGDTIEVRIDDERVFETGEPITIFKVSGEHSGNYVLKIVGGLQTVTWDDSTLLTQGVLVASKVSSGICNIEDDDTKVNVYSADGILIRVDKPMKSALDGLDRGVYIINGKKFVKK